MRQAADLIIATPLPDSFYSVHLDWMCKYVTKEEDRLIEQTKMLELAGEKKKSVKDLRDKSEKK